MRLVALVYLLPTALRNGTFFDLVEDEHTRNSYRWVTQIKGIRYENIRHKIAFRGVGLGIYPNNIPTFVLYVLLMCTRGTLENNHPKNHWSFQISRFSANIDSQCFLGRIFFVSYRYRAIAPFYCSYYICNHYTVWHSSCLVSPKKTQKHCPKSVSAPKVLI